MLVVKEVDVIIDEQLAQVKECGLLSLISPVLSMLR